jgi:phosphatidylglycerol:prolipoprotein diacylglycerol transferase
MINPIALQLGPISIYWYGIVYAVGFIFTLFFLRFHSKQLGLSKDQIEDIVFYGMLFGVIGGRIFHIVFYEPSYYFSHLSEIIRFDKGGMSIHGGFVFGILGIYWRCKKINYNLFKFLDVLVIPLSLVLAFGRVANFINQELYGKITSSSFGYVFESVDSQKRFPSQIFESIKNYVVFTILFFIHYKKSCKVGVLFSWFLILYNGLRFIIDFTRVPENEVFLGIGMGQVLSFIFLIIGIFMLHYFNKKH